MESRRVPRRLRATRGHRAWILKASLAFARQRTLENEAGVQTSLHGRQVNVAWNVTALGATVVLLTTKQTSTRSGRSRGSLCTLKMLTPSGHVAGGAAAGHALTVIANGVPESMLRDVPAVTSSFMSWVPPAA